MSHHLALIYALTWIAAALAWAGVEAVRLNRLSPVPPLLDWTGFACALWLSAPLVLPLVLLLSRRLSKPAPPGRGGERGTGGQASPHEACG